MTGHRLIIAYSKPAASYGFRHMPKARDSAEFWFLKVDSLQLALDIARILTEDGIHGVIKKIPQANPNLRGSQLEIPAQLPHSRNPESPRYARRRTSTWRRKPKHRP
jgi:hypothetical protein